MAHNQYPLGHEGDRHGLMAAGSSPRDVNKLGCPHVTGYTDT